MLKASKICGGMGTLHIHHAFVTTLKPKLPWRCSKCDQAQKRIWRKRRRPRVRIHSLKYVSFAARLSLYDTGFSVFTNNEVSYGYVSMYLSLDNYMYGLKGIIPSFCWR